MYNVHKSINYKEYLYTVGIRTCGVVCRYTYVSKAKSTFLPYFTLSIILADFIFYAEYGHISIYKIISILSLDNAKQTVSAFEYLRHGYLMFAELALVRELSDHALQTHYTSNNNVKMLLAG